MKGTIDLVPIMIISFVLLVGLVAGSILYSGISTTDVWDETYTGDFDSIFSVLDYGGIFILVALGLSVVISAFFIRTHPIFFPIMLIVFLVVLMLSGILTNTFMGYATDSSVSSHANVFSNYLQFMGYLPYFVLGFGLLAIIAMFAKPGGA